MLKECTDLERRVFKLVHYVYYEYFILIKFCFGHALGSIKEKHKVYNLFYALCRKVQNIRIPCKSAYKY